MSVDVKAYLSMHWMSWAPLNSWQMLSFLPFHPPLKFQFCGTIVIPNCAHVNLWFVNLDTFIYLTWLRDWWIPFFFSNDNDTFISISIDRILTKKTSINDYKNNMNSNMSPGYHFSVLFQILSFSCYNVTTTTQSQFNTNSTAKWRPQFPNNCDRILYNHYKISE